MSKKSPDGNRNSAWTNKRPPLTCCPSFDLKELSLQYCRRENLKPHGIMGEETSTVAETLTRASEDSMENSYQLEFEPESPARTPRRWSSMNNQSTPHLSSSASALFQPPKRCSSSSGYSSAAGNQRRSLHESLPQLSQDALAATTATTAAVAVTATISTGSFLRSNFKAQTKPTAASVWQFPPSAGESADALHWKRKLKENKGGTEDHRTLKNIVPEAAKAVASSVPLRAVKESLPEWKQKLLEIKVSSSGVIGGPERSDGQVADYLDSNGQLVADDQNQPTPKSASATPEWKRKFLQMKVATAAAQARDADATDDAAQARSPTTTHGTHPENLVSPIPAWKKTVIKTRQVQAELLALDLKGPIDPKSSAAVNKKVAVADSTHDGTPEWMRKFQSMKFEKEETVIEAGGKQDPGVVTNGNGVVVSWARSTTSTITSRTTAVDEAVGTLREDVVSKTKSLRSVVTQGTVMDSPSTKPAEERDHKEQSIAQSKNTDSGIIFCQLCDKKGHSAKECPQLFAHDQASNCAPTSVSTANDDGPDENPIALTDVEVAEALPKEKKKKKKVKCLLEPSVGEMLPWEEELQSDPTPHHCYVLEPVQEPSGEAEANGKRGGEQKKGMNSEEDVDVDYLPKSLDEAPVRPIAEIFHDVSVGNEAHSTPEPPCEDPTEAKVKTKKKKKDKLACATVLAATESCSTQNPTEAIVTQRKKKKATPSAVDTRWEPISSIPATNVAQLTDQMSPIVREPKMHESFSVSDLQVDLIKSNRKKKNMQDRNSKEPLSDSKSSIASRSQSDVITTTGSTETSTALHESCSSAGESSADFSSNNYAPSIKRSKHKRQGKRERIAPPLNESCSSLESSVASTSRSRRKPDNSLNDDNRTSTSAADVVSALMHESFHDACTACDEQEAGRRATGAFRTPPRSCCDGSKSSESRESTLSSKSSAAKQGESRPATMTAKEVLEERTRIINTLTAFLERSKERMSNRESRIPEGSLRANTDEGIKPERRARACTVIPSEHGAEDRNRKKDPSTVRKPPQRKPRPGHGGVKAESTSVRKRETSRRIEANRPPTTPSSPRRRPGKGSKCLSSSRIARDPEPDITPPTQSETVNQEGEEVFKMVYCNASFQMSRQKICLPTDFDDFAEADLSDGEPLPNTGTLKFKRDNNFDATFESQVTTTDVVVRTSNVMSTGESSFDDFEREVKGKDFSFGGGDDFSVDPFGPSGSFSYTIHSENNSKSRSVGVHHSKNSAGDTRGYFRDDFSVDPFGDALASPELSRNFAAGSADSKTGDPLVPRRRSIESSSSLSSTANPTRRPSADGGTTRLSRRRSVNAGRSNSFQSSRR